MSSSSGKQLISPAVRFKRNSLALMGLFHKFFNKLPKTEKIEMKSFNLAYTYVETTDEDELIIDFIPTTVTHWPRLLDRNNKYFVDNIMNLTVERHRKKLKPYFDLVKDEKGRLRLDAEAVNLVWDYIHNMVKCCIHFLYDNREDKIITGNTILRDLDALALAETWKVDLEKQVYESESDNSDEESSEVSGD